MTSKFKRSIALLMSLAMILALAAGCSRDGQADNPNNPNGGNDQKDNNTPSTSEYVYQPEYTAFPENLSWINSLAYGNGTFVFIGNEVTGARRDYYDENWNLLGYEDIELSEMSEPDSGVSSGGNIIAYDTAVAENEDTTQDEETTEDGKKYCESLDIYYTYSSEYEVTSEVLYRMNVDGSGAEKLPDYEKPALPEGKQGDVYVENLTVDSQGNIWISESGSFYHFDENNQYVWDGDARYIRKLSNTGAQLVSLDISKITEGEEYVSFNGMAVDKEGNLFLSDGNNNQIFLFGNDGVLKNTIELGDQWINSMLLVGDTVHAMYYNNEGGYVLAPIDLATGEFGKEIKLPNNVYNVYTGGVYDLYYNDSTNLYGYDIETGESKALINWIDSDINSNQIRNIIPQEDGTIFATSQNYRASGNSWELVKFTEVPASEIPQKTILTLACVYLDYNLRSVIINFNKSNSTYRIKVNDYSIYNTEDDYNAGRTKLSAEIISGVVPDIIMTSGLPLDTYQNKGLLEDLYPYLQNDAELKDDILYEAFKPLQTEDGKLYTIADSFYFQSLVGASSVVGDTPGWTMKDLEAAMAKMPEDASAFGPEMTRSSLISYMCRMVQDDYIDWTTGTCNFNNEEFKSFLKFIASYPEEINWDEFYGDDYNYETDSTDALIFNGKVMLNTVYMSDFWSYQNCQAMFRNQPFTFVGFPSANGKGTVVSYSNSMAMSSTCADKDGAWEFMRVILTQKYQEENVWNFRINKTAWENSLEDYMTPYTYIDENGNEVIRPNTMYIAGQEIDVGYLTQEDVDQILDILNYAVPETSYDEKIYDIIVEESAAFFSGQKSVDDVCSTIQSRASIYVSEKM